MKPMERSIKKYYQTRTIYLYKRTSYTLKDTIIVFIGIEKIQLLKYGYQLRVSEIPVYRSNKSSKQGDGDIGGRIFLYIASKCGQGWLRRAPRLCGVLLIIRDTCVHNPAM